MIAGSRKNQLRLVASILIVLSLIPLTSAGVSSLGNDAPEKSELRTSATNVTFASTQGGSVNVYDHAGKLVAVHTPTNQRIWTHEEYRRYMDIDPLDTDRLLFVAGERTESGEFQRIAVIINWRTGEELLKFPVPKDTHDVDAVGNGQFAVADKKNHIAYISNPRNGTVVWNYSFKKYFDPATSGNNPDRLDTHLNDIDLHNNGELVLLSPRDFDRVIAVNRSTKETIWTLGREDDHSILNEQHNPLLLEQSPPTVLVADSENQRIVEYVRRDESWQQVWKYEGNLHWPRDADRLPNGNTLIADTANDRVLEVTPDGKTVWEHSISRSPYDVERLQYGDEPAGPPMTGEHSPNAVGPEDGTGLVDKFTAPYETSYNKAYQLIGVWLVPTWAGSTSFFALCFGVLVALVWAGVEIATRLPINPTLAKAPSEDASSLVSGAFFMIAGIGVLPLLAGMADNTAILATLAFVLFAFGLRSIANGATTAWGTAASRLLFATKTLCLAAGCVLCVALVFTALRGFQPGSSHILILCSIVVLVALALVQDTQPHLEAKDRIFS